MSDFPQLGRYPSGKPQVGDRGSIKDMTSKEQMENRVDEDSWPTATTTTITANNSRHIWEKSEKKQPPLPTHLPTYLGSIVSTTGRRNW
ncbi:unnamed protein product [Trichobilharzia regenti]|nr:unnamed protein product [Trichobilharzia regenti]